MRTAIVTNELVQQYNSNELHGWTLTWILDPDSKDQWIESIRGTFSRLMTPFHEKSDACGAVVVWNSSHWTGKEELA